MTNRLLPIQAVAKKLKIPQSYVEQRGPYGAKLSLELLNDPQLGRRGKLILVTATTPTVSGEGKTVTAIGLVQGLEQIGKRALITSREPSLGPVFGMKGGAAGAGRSSLEPSEKINLHFHGDLHAITSAHNLLSALLDTHLFQGNELNIDPNRITWPRALDMNDRALRRITVSVGGKRQGADRGSEFVRMVRHLAPGPYYAGSFPHTRGDGPQIQQDMQNSIKFSIPAVHPQEPHRWSTSAIGPHSNDSPQPIRNRANNRPP